MDDVVFTAHAKVNLVPIIIAVVICIILIVGGIAHYVVNRNKPKAEAEADKGAEPDAVETQPATERELVQNSNWGAHPSQDRAAAQSKANTADA